jgi:signal peptidase
MVLKILVLALLCILVVVSVVMLSQEAPAAIVKGRSMLPLLREGDIVFTIKCSPSEISVGDIIIYRSKFGGKLVVHRVIDVKYNENEGVYYYVTRGDNNALPDYSEFDDVYGVKQTRVVGKVLSINNHVFKIPYIGNLALILRGS